MAADVAGSEGRTVDVVNYDLDNEDDGETWLERVIELTRVTKVRQSGSMTREVYTDADTSMPATVLSCEDSTCTVLLHVFTVWLLVLQRYR